MALRLEALATMSPGQLRAEWRALFDEDAPDVPGSLLRRAIAHRYQEKQLGTLPDWADRMLGAIAEDPESVPEPPIQIKPGTRLLREWNGKLYSVTVTDDGCLYNERRFSSLSHVAREITGAHWSGPRFFGVKRRPPPPSRGGQAHG